VTTAVSIGASRTLNGTPLPCQDEAVHRSAKGFVCMIAYTNYAIDARVRREAETLASHGFQVRCLTTKNGAEQTRFVLNGVEVRELGVRKYRGKSTVAYVGSYLRFMFAASRGCLGLLLRSELDVVHVHNIPDFLVLAGLVPRLSGKKVILDVHDSVPETFATKFSGRAVFRKLLCLEERLSALIAHRVICVNHLQRDTLVARGIPGRKTFISMNVADPSIFKRSSAGGRLRGGASHFNLVYHGTMAERLGVDLVIRATARLRERIPHLRLHLWGGGDDLAGFQQLAKELGLEDLVFFRPKGYPLEELPRHLNSMDLGVVGNRRSVACDLMLPVKLIEYVSLGIPVIVPRFKTIEHYFADDMVSYYEPEDVQSLADSIYRLYLEPAAGRLQAERANGFLREYGWERQGAELVTFYRQLLEN
jgi:glycosyltransferase involved in cell wall biosynthesis